MRLEDIILGGKSVLTETEINYMLDQKQKLAEGGVLLDDQVDVQVVEDMQAEIITLVKDVYGQLEVVEIKEQGGTVEVSGERELMPNFELEIGNNTFYPEVAVEPAQLKKGLAERAIDQDTSMLFVFPNEGKHQMWMKGVQDDLDMLFMNTDGEVTEVLTGIAGDEELLGSRDDTKYVLEVPAGFAEDFDIQSEDQLEIPEEYRQGGNLDDTPDMKLLDHEGNHQMSLKGGERIFSRVKTAQMVEKAKTASTPAELTTLGKIVADEILAQDGRSPQYSDDKGEVVYAEAGAKLQELFNIDMVSLRETLKEFGLTITQDDAV